MAALPRNAPAPHSAWPRSWPTVAAIAESCSCAALRACRIPSPTRRCRQSGATPHPRPAHSDAAASLSSLPSSLPSIALPMWGIVQSHRQQRKNAVGLPVTFIPPLHRMQLDIFDHSRDVMLRNDVLDALKHFDAAAAHAAWHRLDQAYPSDGTLAPSAKLIDVLEQRTDARFADHEAAHEAVRGLTTSVLPAARLLFGGAGGAEWLLPLWRLAAQRASHLPFRAPQAEEHAAALWLQARDWRAAADSVARIESWRRISPPLGWMAPARYRLQGPDGGWPLLARPPWVVPG